MQARLQDALTRVLTEGGQEVLGQPERFRNMLADALGDDVSSLRSEQQSVVRLVAGGGQGLVDGSLDRRAKLSLLDSGRGEPAPAVVDAFDSAVTELGWIQLPVDPTRLVDDEHATVPVASLRADAPVVLARKRPRRGRLVAAAAAAGAFVLLTGGGMAVQRETPSYESAAAAEAPADETAAPGSTEPMVDPASDGASDTGPDQPSGPSSTDEPHASPDPHVDPPPSGTHDDAGSYDGRGSSGITHDDPYPRPVVYLSADTDLLTVGDYTTLSASSQYASGYRWLDPTGQCTDSAPLCTVTCSAPFQTVTIGLVGLGLGGESAPSFVSILCIDEPPVPPDFPPDFPPPPEPPY